MRDGKPKKVGDITLKEMKRICEDPNNECAICPIKTECQILDIEPFEWDEEFLNKEIEDET